MFGNNRPTPMVGVRTEKACRVDKHGFSLIQLIIAIAILVTLMALFAPTIGKAIERSRNAACQSNLRHFGVALHGYMAESNTIPPYKFWWPNPDDPEGANIGGAVWYGLLAPYLPGTSTPSGNWVHTCKSAEVPYQRSKSGSTMYGFANYGYNAGVSGTPAWPITQFTDIEALMIMSDSTATEKLYNDGAQSWIIQQSRPEERSDPDRKNNFAFRHFGKTNILFADGRIESRTNEEIPFYTYVSPRPLEGRQFWYGY